MGPDRAGRSGIWRRVTGRSAPGPGRGVAWRGVAWRGVTGQTRWGARRDVKLREAT